MWHNQVAPHATPPAQGSRPPPAIPLMHNNSLANNFEQQRPQLAHSHKGGDNNDNILAHKLQMHEKFYIRVVHFWF